MYVVTSNACSHVREASERHSVVLAVALLGALLCSSPAPAADNRPAGPSLYVPSTGSRPVIDGQLDEPGWKDAARTGPLKVTASQPGTSTTEAFILHDAGQLYVALRCNGQLAESGDGTASVPPNCAGIRRLAHQLECRSELLLPDSDYAGRRWQDRLLLQ